MFVIRNHRVGSIYALATLRIGSPTACAATPWSRAPWPAALPGAAALSRRCGGRSRAVSGRGPRLADPPSLPLLGALRPHLAFPFGVSSGRGLLRGQDEELRCEPGLRGQVQRVLETDWGAGQGDPEGGLGDPEEVKPAAWDGAGRAEPRAPPPNKAAPRNTHMFLIHSPP